MKKKYIYLIGILVVICLVIFVVFYNKGDSVKVYDKYSAYLCSPFEKQRYFTRESETITDKFIDNIERE